MKNMKEREAMLMIRLPVGVKTGLQEAARKDRRTMTGLVEKLIVDHLEREGIPWEEDAKPRPRGKKKK